MRNGASAPVRVLFLTWEYPPHILGGLGKHVADLVPALAKEGVVVSVVTPMVRSGKAHETITPNIHVYRIPIPPIEQHQSKFLLAPSPAFVRQVNDEIERAIIHLSAEQGEFDLIHTHDWLMAAAAINLKLRWRIPLVATIHATERGRGQGILISEQSREIDGLEWWLTYEAWRVIVCSKFMKCQLGDYFRTPADKIDVVPNGVYVHPNPFSTHDERQTFRRRFAVDDELIALSLGRMVYEKGLHVLLSAWPHVLQEMKTKARLVIAGTGPCLDGLKAQAESLGLQHYVTFTGFISDEDRDRLYHVANVSVFPSIYEPFGIVALEAAAAGCPVVVTQTGGLQEVMRLHETGIVVFPNNVESLTWGIVHSLQNPKWSRIRAANALKEVRENYNWQHIAHETLAVYCRVIHEWHASSWRFEVSNVALA